MGGIDEKKEKLGVLELPAAEDVPQGVSLTPTPLAIFYPLKQRFQFRGNGGLHRRFLVGFFRRVLTRLPAESLLKEDQQKVDFKISSPTYFSDKNLEPEHRRPKENSEENFISLELPEKLHRNSVL